MCCVRGVFVIGCGLCALACHIASVFVFLSKSSKVGNRQSEYAIPSNQGERGIRALCVALSTL